MTFWYVGSDEVADLYLKLTGSADTPGAAAPPARQRLPVARVRASSSAGHDAASVRFIPPGPGATNDWSWRDAVESLPPTAIPVSVVSREK
jgi:hypothetical protein